MGTFSKSVFHVSLQPLVFVQKNPDVPLVGKDLLAFYSPAHYNRELQQLIRKKLICLLIRNKCVKKKKVVALSHSLINTY